ncbi:MAG: hypothetical protein IPM40_09110 [Gammaproteobacteria bacterium]|nr:hypothetical protein [Gammaproteobacteria bacterium]
MADRPERNSAGDRVLPRTGDQPPACKHGIDGRIIEDAAFTVIGAFDESQFAHRKSELAFVQLSLPELTDEFTGQ